MWSYVSLTWRPIWCDHFVGHPHPDSIRQVFGVLIRSSGKVVDPFIATDGLYEILGIFDLVHGGLLNLMRGGANVAEVSRRWSDNLLLLIDVTIVTFRRISTRR